MLKRLFLLLLLIAVSMTVGCAKHNIAVQLDGANDAAVAEAFGKIVGSADGVVSSKRIHSSIVPDNPQQSSVLWQTDVKDIDAFTLQTNIMDMVRELNMAGGYLTMYGVDYRYSPDELSMMRGLRPADATVDKLWFIVDRELARDRE